MLDHIVQSLFIQEGDLQNYLDHWSEILSLPKVVSSDYIHL
jgi:hypothetical protein